MSNQEIANSIQYHLSAAIHLATSGVKEACTLAAKDAGAAQSVPVVAEGLGHLWQAHAAFTQAAATMPDVTPKFGGDGK